MAQYESSPLPQYYGQQMQDGTMIESPTAPRHTRGSSDSRQELLRLPMQPHQAHIDSTMEPISPIMPMDNNDRLGVASKTSNRRIGGQSDPNDWNAPGTAYAGPNAIQPRRRQQSQEFRGGGPVTSNTHRSAYVEDYSDDEDEARAYRRRPSRRHKRPPVAYENYSDANARYGHPTGRRSIDSYTAYDGTPTKQNLHMHYGSDDDAGRPQRPGPGGRGPPRRPPSSEDVMRLPWMIWMGSNAKNHFVAFIGEFVGTTMFLFFAFSGTQVANIGSSASPDDKTTTGGETGFSPQVLLYIALVFAFSLMVNVWVFFRISGGLFNPAVTFAMLLCRALSPVRAVLLLAAQIAGGIFSSFLVSVLFPTEFNVRTTLSQRTSLAQGVCIEAILTAELVFTIFMLAKEKHKGKPLLTTNSPNRALTFFSNIHSPRWYRSSALHR